MVSTDTSFGNVDLGEVESWVRLIHGSGEGYVHICSTLSWSGRAFDVTQNMPSLLNYVAGLHRDGAKGIYMRATTINRHLEPGERGSVADSVSLPGFWADIDIAGPNHKTTKPLPPDQTEAARIVAEARLPEPTLWVHSGGGLYPWWLFEHPIHMVTPDVVDAMQDLSTRWQDCLVAAAERLGYSYGGVGDLARVLRVSGTLNRKTVNWAKCHIIWDEGQRLADEEIESALATAEEYLESVQPRKTMVPTIPMPRSGEPTGERPGDDLANRMSWDEIMESGGYQLDRRQGEETYWVRPGKNRRDGHSCTTNYRGSDLLYVFSTEMEGFDNNETYSKFAAWSILNGYGRDLKAASKDLRSRGFGAQRPQPARSPQPFQPGPLPEEGTPSVQEEPAPVVVPTHYNSTDDGSAQRLQYLHGNGFRWVGQHNAWYAWNGEVWKQDHTKKIMRAAAEVSQMIIDEARDRQEYDEEHTGKRACKCGACDHLKYGLQTESAGRRKSIIENFSGLAGIAIEADTFDANKKLVTVGNGVLDPEKRILHKFDPRRMFTRQMAVDYNPEASAPKFEQFLEQVLPDAAMRDYVQRAIGYSLLGENDRRALFMLHGPSGTGKSQFLNIFEGLFGDFGTAAPAATFRIRKSETTNDLHYLRNKRFVTTSETSETTAMDEELIKRITGRDSMTSRDLYQSNTTWEPECAIWFATNFPPKLNSDDSAIWSRFKPINFAVQFTGGPEIPNLGKRILEEEASGILNWVLEGVRKYRERGLGEPQELTEAVEQQRLDADNVAQFLDAALEEGRLVEQEAAIIKRSQLFELYERWCQQERIVPFGQRRFTNRVRALKGYDEVKVSVMHWQGLGINGQMGLLGTMG